MPLDKYVSYAAKSFTLPDICVRLRSTLDDPRSSIEDIAVLVSADPSLTAKVLRLANSSLFRFPSQIASLTKAINVIGGEALYNLVIAETATTAFKHFDTLLIDLDKHWHASVYCGMVAKSLAMRLNIRGAERFFVMGILQNLSELIIAKKEPKRYDDYRQAQKSELPHIEQLAHFGFTFAHCSGIILEKWHLPIGLYYPISFMNEEAKYASDVDICVLALASRITLSQLDKESYADIELFTPEIANTVSLDMEVISNSIEYAEQETAKIVSLIH
ncbi:MULTISPECIES: HDOD domain-containing protein [Alteromonas]|uniref:Histidine kinase n=1 Tax=Alteromonas macleodii TaxID=28108 RepID=A0A6T9Y3X1_ALTMA|nr:MULTISPECIES: HDOD domain-containing protein [Alteromonas]MCZ8529033.1 HDOD domain-containing protein [Alteromonas sp. PRIM-21]CAB9494946.1 Histidine kinase [Alteromonas macleodii]